MGTCFSSTWLDMPIQRILPKRSRTSRSRVAPGGLKGRREASPRITSLASPSIRLFPPIRMSPRSRGPSPLPARTRNNASLNKERTNPITTKQNNEKERHTYETTHTNTCLAGGRGRRLCGHTADQNHPYGCAAALKAEFGVVGFAGQGWTVAFGE